MRLTRLAAVGAIAVVAAAAGVGTATAVGHSPSSDRDAAVAQALKDRTPKNVIYFLGDGMGTQEITAARYYQGVDNPLNVDRMPVTGFQTTYSLKPGAQAPYLPDYDPDSAATG